MLVMGVEEEREEEVGVRLVRVEAGTDRVAGGITTAFDNDAGFRFDGFRLVGGMVALTVMVVGMKSVMLWVK